MKTTAMKISGITLLVLGFFFFYLAGTFDFDCVTKYHDEVNLSSISSFLYEHEFGTVSHWTMKPYDIFMQPNDYLIISYEPVDVSWTNGSVYIVLWRPVSEGYPLECSTLMSRELSFENKEGREIMVQPYLASDNPYNTLSTTITLHHYERPHWLWYGLGVISGVSALIVIWKTKHVSIPEKV